MNELQIYLVDSLLVVRIADKNVQYQGCTGEGFIKWDINDKSLDPEGVVLTGPMLFEALQELKKEGL